MYSYVLELLQLYLIPKLSLEICFGADTGFDMGLFDTGATEDDLPDIHARSVKSVVTERQADYIGKGTKTSDLE